MKTEKPEYVYSLDGENFFELDELEEDDLRNIAFRGIPVPRQHSEFIRADAIIEDIQEVCWNEIGEPADGYLDDITEDDKVELTKLISDWLVKKVGEVPFYAVKNITEYRYDG